jgi:type IV pilus assembly protein PilW
MKTFPAKQFQNGLTLIELLIAMVLAALLLAGILQIFISSKQAYKLQENLSRLQENGRFAMDFITKDVRIAEYTGCTKTLPATNPADTITELTKLNGSNNVTNINWMAACGSLCTLGTDAITFQYAKSCGGQLTNKMAGSAVGSSIKIGANSCNIIVGSPVLVGDCTTSHVFTAAANTTNTKDANNNTTASDIKIDKAFLTAKDYDLDAEVYAFQNNATYFIRTGASGMPALFRVDSSGTNELVEGVENMQILYGVDSDTPNLDFLPNYYLDATALTALPPIPTNIKDPNTGIVSLNSTFPAWARVVSIRISLLVVSPDNGIIEDAPPPYIFNGLTITPPDVCFNNGITTTTLPCTAPAKQMPDLRLHRVFSTTIAVRNRLP